MAGQRIEFKFTGDIGDLRAALREAEGAGKKTGKALSDDVGKKGTKGLLDAKKAAELGTSALKATAVAAGAAAAAVAGIAVAAVKAGARFDAIAKKAKQIGSSAEDIQVLSGALELGGVDAATAEAAMAKLNLRLAEAAAGGGPAVDVLKQLGLSAQELQELPLPERFALLADRMDTLGTVGEKTNAAVKLMEEGGIRLISAFEGGGAAIRESSEAVREAGIVSNETAAQGEVLTDAVGLMARSLGALRDDVLTPLMPVLTGMANGIREAVAAFRRTDDVEQFGQTIVTVFQDWIAPAIASAVSIFLKARAHIEPTLLSLEVGALRAEQAFKALSFQWEEAVAITSKLQGKQTELEQSVTTLEGALADADAAATGLLEGMLKAETALPEVAKGAGQLAAEADLATEATKELTAASNEAGQAALNSLAALGDAAVEEKRIAQEVADEKIASIEAVQRKEEEARDQRHEQGLEALAAAQDISNQVFGIISDAAAAEMNVRISAIQETADQIESIEEQLTQTLSSQERERLENRQAALEQQSQQERAEAEESWKRTQALAIVQATVNTALAAINALATAPNIVVGLIMAGLATAAGVAAIATIASQPPPQFHSGGMISAGGANDEVMIRARAREAVLSPQGVAAAGGADAVGRLNQGRGGADGPNVTVMQVGNRVVDAMVHESLRTGSGRLNREFRSVRPRRIGRHNPFRSI